jgi:pimeloyl-ACP methyl ester carboxylesterase
MTIVEHMATLTRFEYVGGAGHWVHSQKPKEFLQMALKFISEPS